MLDNLIRYNLFSMNPIAKTTVPVTGNSHPQKKQRHTKQEPVFAAHDSKKN